MPAPLRADLTPYRESGAIGAGIRGEVQEQIVCRSIYGPGHDASGDVGVAVTGVREVEGRGRASAYIDSSDARTQEVGACGIEGRAVTAQQGR